MQLCPVEKGAAPPGDTRFVPPPSQEGDEENHEDSAHAGSSLYASINDEAGRRGNAQPSSEVASFQSSVPSLAHGSDNPQSLQPIVSRPVVTTIKRLDRCWSDQETAPGAIANAPPATAARPLRYPASAVPASPPRPRRRRSGRDSRRSRTSSYGGRDRPRASARAPAG
jgi:hypothetical protein